MIFVNNEEKNIKHLTVESNDKFQEVYGGMNPSGVSAITVLLAVLMIIFSVLSIIFGKYYLLWIFVPVLAVLIISTIIRKKNEKKYIPPEHTNLTEAIFKDHEI